MCETSASILSTLLPSLLLVAAAPALAQEPPIPIPPRPPIVVTSGHATVTRSPDRAVVTFTTETRAPKPAEAQRTNAAAMAQVQRAVLQAGVLAESVRTLGFNLREDVQWNAGKRVSQGYIVTNSIEVRVDDLDSLGGLLDRAVAAGANSVGGVRFDLKDRAAAEREALRLAVADARARADAAASGAELRVVQVLRVEESSQRAGPPIPVMRMAAASADAATPVSPGEIEIEASVTLTASVAPR
jgi:uncharacterized protein